jgi:hypothetical protein
MSGSRSSSKSREYVFTKDLIDFADLGESKSFPCYPAVLVGQSYKISDREASQRIVYHDLNWMLSSNFTHLDRLFTQNFFDGFTILQNFDLCPSPEKQMHSNPLGS